MPLDGAVPGLLELATDAGEADDATDAGMACAAGTAKPPPTTGSLGNSTPSLVAQGRPRTFASNDTSS